MIYIHPLVNDYRIFAIHLPAAVLFVTVIAGTVFRSVTMAPILPGYPTLFIIWLLTK